MNPNTGKIVRDINTLDEDERSAFRYLKGDDATLAEIFLDGKDKKFLDLKGNHPLAKVAKKMRLEDMTKCIIEVAEDRRGNIRIQELLNAKFPVQAIYEKLKKERFIS